MLSPEKIGRFAAETNIQLQKAFVISFSIALFLALQGDIINNIATLIYDFSPKASSEKKEILTLQAKKHIIIFAQYIMIYVLLQYTFNYVFASISYFTRFNKWRSIYSLGLFPLGRITLDYVFPVGFAFYVLYTINDTDACKGCLSSSDDKIANDFGKFQDWLASYIAAKFASFYYYIEPIFTFYKIYVVPYIYAGLYLLINLYQEAAEAFVRAYFLVKIDDLVHAAINLISTVWTLINVTLSLLTLGTVDLIDTFRDGPTYHQSGRGIASADDRVQSERKSTDKHSSDLCDRWYGWAFGPFVDCPQPEHVPAARPPIDRSL